MSNSSFKIERIEIEGFRGYNDTFKQSLTKPMTILFGENGVGKSSTLMAIEWCLFGDVEYLAHLEGRTRDELVNQFSSSGIARVLLQLNDGTRTYKISRTKRAGSTKDEFGLMGPDGEYEGEDAASKVFQLLKTTLDDFIRAIYLHQESVKGLLVEDMASRDEALDRLFGLERIRNIVESVPLSKIRAIADELETKKDTLGRRIEGAVQQCQLDLNRLRTKTANLGVPQEDISIDLASKISQTIVQTLSPLSSEYGVAPVTTGAPTGAKQFDGFERKIKNSLRELQSRLVGTSKITELQSSKTRLENVLRKYNDNRTELASNQSQLDDYRMRFGNPDAIPSKRTSLSEQVTQCEKRRMALDDKSTLVSDALRLLKSDPASRCPVCGQDFNLANTIKRLEEETQGLISQQLDEIDREKRELQARDQLLAEAQASISRLLDKNRVTNTALQSTISETSAILGVTISGGDELASTIGAQLTQLENQISEFSAVYTARNAVLEELRSDLDKVVAIFDVMNKEAEFSEINSHFKSESDEIRELDAAITELRSFEGKLTTIVKTAGEVQAGLAKSVISVSQDDIESIYNRLCRHPMYDRLRVDVKPREARGLVKNSYSIKAYNSKLGTETFVSTRFSTGQMNSVAIAICLALARRLPLKLGFLILDDPSQSLDSEHKVALAKILREVSAEKQLIVSTHDDELLRMLHVDVTDAQTIRFGKWGIAGPNVEAR